MELLKQIGEFVLQALPTVILVFLFYRFLRANLFQPLEKVMVDRSARIEGARRESEAIQAAAQEKLRAYQDAQKRARAEAYVEQEAARRVVLGEKASMLRESRNRANDKIRAAKEAIAQDIATARAQLKHESQALGAEIARKILNRRPPVSPPAKGAQ